MSDASTLNEGGQRPMMRIRIEPSSRMDAGSLGALLYHLDLMFREQTDGDLALGVARLAEGSLVIELDALLTAGASAISLVNAATSFGEFVQSVFGVLTWIKEGEEAKISARQKQLGFVLYQALPTGGHIEIKTVANDKMALEITSAALQIAMGHLSQAALSADPSGPTPLSVRVPKDLVSHDSDDDPSLLAPD